MTTALFTLLNSLDRLAGAVRRLFVRQPVMTSEEIQQQLDAGIAEVRRQFHDRFEEISTSYATSKIECDAAAEAHREAAARHDEATEGLRSMINLGVARVLTRADLFRCRN